MTQETSTSETPTTGTVAFLGTGSMNGSILRGLLAAGVPTERVRATTRSAGSAEKLHGQTGVTVHASESDPAANREAVAGADVVVLGVKPVGITDLAADIADALAPEAIVVSVAAAITTEMIEAQLRAGQPVVRAMPNTPTSLGKGVTSISAGTNASEADLARVAELLAPTGTVVEVPEDQVNAVAAISGSGPAYAFYLAEIMAAAGEKLGLDKDLARELAAKTVAGAGAMLAQDAQNRDGANPAALRRAVTSPNGTTEAAIKVFEEKHLGQIMDEATEAARERAVQITDELKAKTGE